MLPAVRPEPSSRRSINQAVHAEINLCYTCGSCVSECPVNRATNKLQPRKLVWMANLGLLHELVRLPDIWYCLSCNRCSHVCPMTVKPATLIRFLRWEAVRSGVASSTMRERLGELRREFHLERWRAVADLMGPTSTPLPLPTAAQATFQGTRRSTDLPRLTATYLGLGTNLTSCFACEECSNACPVSLDRRIFDPLRLIRMANMGMEAELLSSPSLWLCVQCQSCTRTCGQNVKGHLIISRLRELAIDQGAVMPELKSRWRDQEMALYSRHLEDIDGLLAAGG
jgi:heterodisulfide reductase subunit C